MNTEKLKLKLETLLAKAPHEMQSAMKMTVEKGAASWVTATPRHSLHKGDFIDAIYMRYGWLLPDLPINCQCHAAYSLQHVLDCKLGGFPENRQ